MKSLSVAILQSGKGSERSNGNESLSRESSRRTMDILPCYPMKLKILLGVFHPHRYSFRECRFNAKLLLKYEKELDIEHEFGIKHNPNSQAYIESFDVLKKHPGVSLKIRHSCCQREFETHVLAFDKEDLKNKMNAYIHYYHCLRPHGSLGNMTPFDFRKEFFENPSVSKKLKVYV